jgi:hypothetical protein
LKIQIISSHPHGACSYYRAHGVLPKIKNVQTEAIETVSWQQLSNTDIVFIERPHDKTFLEACKIVKNFGIKVWVDFDDNLFCLPEWNPAKDFYKSESTQACMIESMKLADIVTVATDAIKEAYIKYNKNIVVIPNAFNNYNFNLDYNLSNKNVILWRGSNTHRGDILPYLKKIWEIAKDKDKWQWHFIGNDLWWIVDYIRNHVTTKELDIIRYFNKIKSINPAIYIVPLDFNEFNLAKSNCGWLEATYAGAVTLAPDMPEWRRPGIINYRDKKEFELLLIELMDNPKLRKQNYKKSFDFIKSNLLLSTVNKKREEVIKSL